MVVAVNTGKRAKRLTREQLDALRAFRRAGGRYWKRALLEAWDSHGYPMFPHADMASVLQRLRNERGPAWLKRLELKRSAHDHEGDRP